MNTDYVVLKLITGETIMAMFEGEDDKFVKVEYPIQIRTMLIPEINKETISAAPYCPFSDSKTYILEKSHIVYIKRLHHAYIKHYKEFLKSYEEAMIPTTRRRYEEEQSLEGFDDLDDLTLEEIQNRLDILESIANAPREDVSEEDLEKRVFVPGNETKH
jgi:hypothetical protein